ncbi:alcohol dehydrogenase [Stemphylium lycopersici]|nr:alcohol dehydrogenase [Stemphylium lycopersici]RAR12050.1 alcohol dehydrogenase [Stemphylium lycopersici]
MYPARESSWQVQAELQPSFSLTIAVHQKAILISQSPTKRTISAYPSLPNQKPTVPSLSSHTLASQTYFASMQLSTLLVILIPITTASAKVWNMSGTCRGEICEIDHQYVNPADYCEGRQGKFVGEGNAGRTWCAPEGTKCTYVWGC